LEKVALFDCVEAEGTTAKGKSKKINICPRCHKKGFAEQIRSQSEKFGYVPVLVCYLVSDGKRTRRIQRSHDDPNLKARDYFEKYDIGKINEIRAKPTPYWYPSGYDMTGFNRFQRDALFYYGVKEVADLFTKRNLWALAALKAHIPSDSPLNFCFSSILLNSSRHRDGGLPVKRPRCAENSPLSKRREYHLRAHARAHETTCASSPLASRATRWSLGK